jgi:hypothetical protein
MTWNFSIISPRIYDSRSPQTFLKKSRKKILFVKSGLKEKNTEAELLPGAKGRGALKKRSLTKTKPDNIHTEMLFLT